MARRLCAAGCSATCGAHAAGGVCLNDLPSIECPPDPDVVDRELDTDKDALNSPRWPKLSEPATVGGGTFHVGASSRLVVEAAQRAYKYKQEQVACNACVRSVAHVVHGLPIGTELYTRTDTLTVQAARHGFAERVPGFMTALAVSLGITHIELQARLEAGDVTKDDAIEALAKRLLEPMEPAGFLLQWPAPGGGRETLWSETGAAAEVIGCPAVQVFKMKGGAR